MTERLFDPILPCPPSPFKKLHKNGPNLNPGAIYYSWTHQGGIEFKPKLSAHFCTKLDHLVVEKCKKPICKFCYFTLKLFWIVSDIKKSLWFHGSSENDQLVLTYYMQEKQYVLQRIHH